MSTTDLSALLQTLATLCEASSRKLLHLRARNAELTTLYETSSLELLHSRARIAELEEQVSELCVEVAELRACEENCTAQVRKAVKVLREAQSRENAVIVKKMLRSVGDGIGGWRVVADEDIWGRKSKWEGKESGKVTWEETIYTYQDQEREDEVYVAISMMTEFEGWSMEELRLSDYESRRGNNSPIIVCRVGTLNMY